MVEQIYVVFQSANYFPARNLFKENIGLDAGMKEDWTKITQNSFSLNKTALDYSD